MVPYFSGLATSTGPLPQECMVVWNALGISTVDPLEQSLATNMMQLAADYVASGPQGNYVGAWEAFVRFCKMLLPPRVPLPAEPVTVALYLTGRGQTANTFFVIKTASAAIFHYHQISLFGSIALWKCDCALLWAGSIVPRILYILVDQ